MGVGHDDDVDVFGSEPDRREVCEDPSTVRPHRLAGAGFQQNPPATGLDQKSVEVQRHVIDGKKCSSQHVRQFGFGCIAGIHPGRPADQTVAEDRRGDLTNPEPIMRGVAGDRHDALR